MSIDSKISQAKAKLLVEYPLFGTLASKLELIKNDDIQSFKSDGIKLEYNSDFFDSLSINEISFVFANGAMHASLSYESRRLNRSGWLWQMSTDLSINDMLTQNGLERPELAEYRVRFKGMYAEEIYAELKDDILREEDNLEYDADDVNDIDPNDVNEDSSTESNQGSKDNRLEESSLCNNEHQEEQLLQEQLFGEFAQSTTESEALKEDLPLHVERFFTLNTKATVDWREELREAIDEFHKDDYTLLPPNKKFLHQGIYIPSSISNKFNLVVAIDSSGSIDEELLDRFLSELNFLMSMVQNYQIELIVCDDKIQSHQTLYSGETLEVSLVGGGGTDFRPVFKYLEEELQDVKLLLYFTDLDGTFPQDEPTCRVKWVVQKELEVPFGSLIVLD